MIEKKASRQQILHTFRNSLNRASSKTLNRVKVRGTERTVSAIGGVAPLIYGEVRTAGKYLAGPINHGSDLVFGIIWSCGLCEGTQELYVNNLVPENDSDFAVTEYFGEDSQPIDPTLEAAFLANGETFTDTYNKIAYSVFKIKSTSIIEGWPRIEAVYRGRIITDPRTGKSEYTENPSLFFHDFVVNDFYGMSGQTLGIKECADKNDDLFPFGAPRCLAGLNFSEEYEDEEVLSVIAEYAELLWGYEGEKIIAIPDSIANRKPSIGRGGVVSTEGDLAVNTNSGIWDFYNNGPIGSMDLYVEHLGNDAFVKTIPVTMDEDIYKIDFLEDFTPEDLFNVEQRNTFVWSNDISHSSWILSGGASKTDSHTVSLPANDEYIRKSNGVAISPGDTVTISVFLSGSGTVRLALSRDPSGATTYESAVSAVTLTSTPTRYSLTHTFQYAHVSADMRVGRFAGYTATSVTIHRAQMEYGSVATDYQEIESEYSQDGVYLPVGEEFYKDVHGTDKVVHVGSLVKSWKSKTNGLISIQATDAYCPRYGRHPKGGIRNLLQWSEDLSKPIWETFSGASISGTNIINTPDNGFNNYAQQEFEYSVKAGDKATAKVLLSGTGVAVLSVARIQTGSYEGTSLDITLTSTPTWYEVSHSFSADHASFGIRIGRLTTGTTLQIICDAAQLEYGDVATNYQKTTERWDITESGVDDVYALFFDGNDFLSFASSNGAFKYLHNGKGGEVVVAASIGHDKNPEDNGHLLHTTATSTATGTYLYFNDLVSESANNRIFFMSSGGSGNAMATDVDNDNVSLMAPHVIGGSFIDEGDQRRISAFLNGDLLDSNVSTSMSPTDSNSNNDLNIGNSLECWIHGVVVIDRILTDVERAKVNQFFANYSGANVQTISKVKYEPVIIPDHYISRRQIVADSLRITTKNVRGAPNSMAINYLPSTGDSASWVQKTVTVQSSAVSLGVDDPLESVVDMHGIGREIEAEMKGIRRFNRKKFPSEYAFTMFDEGVKIKRGDVLELPSQDGLDRQWVRVLDSTMTKDAKYQIAAEHYSDEMHQIDIESAYPDSPVYDGFIIPYSGELPAGWAAYTAVQGKYIRTAGDGIAVNSTGGSETAGPWSGSTSENDLHVGPFNNSKRTQSGYGDETFLSEDISGPPWYATIKDTGESVNFKIPETPDSYPHSHDVDIESFVPNIPKQSFKFMKRSGGTGETIPANGLVFGDEDVKGSGINRILDFEGKLLFAGETSGAFINTTIPVASKCTIEGYGANHAAHETETAGTKHSIKFGDDYYYGRISNAQSAGAHNHALQGEFSVNLDRVQVPVYGGSTEFKLKRGMIVFWDASTGSIPEDWYLCDGTNGTRNLLKKYFEMSGIKTNEVSGDNTISFSGKVVKAKHSHANNTAVDTNFLNGLAFHGDEYHDHDLEIEISWIAQYYALYPIKYLPEAIV